MKQDHIQYGNSTIDYSLEYADRKTLGIKVHPDKSVQVVAPLDSTEVEIKKKVRSKASWILKQQDFFLSFHPITPPRQFVSGETHLYLGRQYRLKLRKSGKEQVKLRGGMLEVFVKDKSDTSGVRKLLKAWYREKAIYHFEKIFAAMVPLTQSFYSGEPSLKYRWMQKRWGSCDKHSCIHLNLELIKAPKKCIEYVIVHELCHLAHLNHSRPFYALLEKLYPEWKETKDRLEKMMV